MMILRWLGIDCGASSYKNHRISLRRQTAKTCLLGDHIYSRRCWLTVHPFENYPFEAIGVVGIDMLEEDIHDAEVAQEAPKVIAVRNEKRAVRRTAYSLTSNLSGHSKEAIVGRFRLTVCRPGGTEEKVDPELT